MRGRFAVLKQRAGVAQRLTGLRHSFQLRRAHSKAFNSCMQHFILIQAVIIMIATRKQCSSTHSASIRIYLRTTSF